MASTVIDVGKTEETEVSQALALLEPDTSALPAVDFTVMLSVTVTDQDSRATVVSNAKVAQDYIGEVDSLFDRPTKIANRLHKWFTGRRGELKAPAQAVVDHGKRQVKAFDDKIERERLELQRKAQAEIDRKAREEAERLKAEQIANAMPWEIEEVARKEVYVPPTPTVVVPVDPTPKGSSYRNTPWTYELFDLAALVKAAATDPTLLEALTVNDKYLKMKAKELQLNLEKRFPGVRGVRDKNISFR